MSNFFRWNAGRKRQGTPTLESQPGAHTGDSRQYIPGYSDSNIVYLDTVSGNDANDGSTELLAKLTYASAATAAGTTKKIRVINNNAALSTNITKPTEMKRGVSGTISSSLTDPVASLTASATPAWTSGQPRRVTWSPKLGKWYGVGSTEIVSSSDGDTWTLEETISGALGYRIQWDEASGRIYVLCTAGKLLYSTDGSTYTTLTVGSDQLGALAYSETLGRYALGSLNYIYYSSDGLTWESSPISTDNAMSAGIYADGKFVFFNGNGEEFLSTDGINWIETSPLNSYEVTALTYMENAGLFIAADVDGGIYSSADAVTWTNRRAATAAPCYDALYIKETGVAVISESGRILTRSTNGTAWTSTAALAAYSAGDQIRGASYSPLRGRLVTVGGNDGGTTRKAAFGPLYANTISASIAGFTVQAVQYSGTVTAYNCTMYQPGTTAALSLNACRVTESGAHISNNSQAHFGTLFEGDAHFTAVPASANAFDFNCNTVAGTLYVYNGSETHYERIRDNIIEDGVQASYPLTVTSGNTRGTSSDGVIFGQFHTTADPLFVDETDYKIKRVLDGYQYDSPMVAASQYYYNQATTQTFRDNGAWSYNESAATYKYQRTFDFLMPATVNGSSIDFIRHNRANLHVAEDGTPDTANTPDSRWEEIVMTYKTLPESHITFIDWLEGQVDMTCDISLSPSLTPTTSVTASGTTSAGEAVITVTDNSGLDSGDRLTIDGNEYTVLYTYGTTKAVLDRVTTTALSNGESITVKYDTGFGEYQYVPQLERRLSRWYETDSTYQRGLTIRFARKLP